MTRSDSPTAGRAQALKVLLHANIVDYQHTPYLDNNILGSIHAEWAQLLNHQCKSR